MSPEVMKDSLLVEKLSSIEEKYLEENLVIDRAFLEKIGLLELEGKGTGTGKTEKNNLKVLFSYNKEPGKIGVNDFVAYFNKRFEMLSSILRQRQELQNPISINRLRMKKDREGLAIIGMVFDKKITIQSSSNNNRNSIFAGIANNALRSAENRNQMMQKLTKWGD